MEYYRIKPEFQSEYSLGPSVLVRVDTRGIRGGCVHTYAPITTGGRVIYSQKFEDSFNEVEKI